MKTQSDLIKERLQNMMLSDRGNGTENLLTMLKSDILDLLASYMYTTSENVNVSLSVIGGGDYEIKITARGDRLIDVGKTID